MQRHAHGYTLIELLLVIALVVIAAAVVAPSLLEGGDRSQLDDAAQKLAELWGGARLDAITSGSTLLFQCELGGALGRLQDPAAVVDPRQNQQAVAGALKEIQLNNVVFLSLMVAEPAGSEPLGADLGAGAPSLAIAFRPDGAASDAEAILQHDSGLQLKVTLRGLTGAVRVEEVTAEEE